MSLNYGQLVTMTLLVNDQLKEIVRLEYCGVIGLNWHHFVNIKTKENHLVKEEQFPLHIWRMGECVCKLSYQ